MMNIRENGNVRESGKEGEKGEEKTKNLLTWRADRDIIFKRSRKGASEEEPERGRGNLENDTEKREKRQLILK